MPWGDGTPRDHLANVPHVSDPELANALAELFRARAVIPGDTAGALRIEVAAGTHVGGRSHAQ